MLATVDIRRAPIPVDLGGALVVADCAAPLILVDISGAAAPVPPDDGGSGSTSPSIASHAFVSPVGGVLTLPLAKTIVVDLTAPVTRALLPAYDGDLRFTVYLRQDSVGGHSVGGWPADVVWLDGAPPQLSLTPGAIDCLAFDVLAGDIILGGLIGGARTNASLSAAIAEKQPLDPTLTALAAVETAADRVIYATGPDQFATTPLTPFGRTLIGSANASAANSALSNSVLDGGNF